MDVLIAYSILSPFKLLLPCCKRYIDQYHTPQLLFTQQTVCPITNALKLTNTLKLYPELSASRWPLLDYETLVDFFNLSVVWSFSRKHLTASICQNHLLCWFMSRKFWIHHWHTHLLMCLQRDLSCWDMGDHLATGQGILACFGLPWCIKQQFIHLSVGGQQQGTQKARQFGL